MRTLFFDFETTGIVSMNLPADHPEQPHIVQVAAILVDGDREVSTIDLVVDPYVEVPAGAAKIHGITTEIARSVGVTEKSAIVVLSRLLLKSDIAVAHNAKFDFEIAQTASARAGFKIPWPHRIRCTMEASTPVVNLPPTERMIAAGKTGPKSPKLEECVRFFFNEEHVGAHSALADVRACRRVYAELIRRGTWSKNEGAAA